MNKKIYKKFLWWMCNESNFAESTYKRHLVTCKQLYSHGLMNKNAGKKEFLEFCDKRRRDGLSSASIIEYYKTMKHWLRFIGADWGNELAYPPNRARGQKSPPLETVLQFLEQDTGEMWHIYWLLHVNCGTRPSEIRLLTVDDFDWENGCFYPKTTKCNDQTAIIMFDWLIPKIKSYCRKLTQKYLFTSRFSRGKPVSIAAVEKDCRRRLEMIGCETHYTPYSFRRAFATIGVFDGKMPVVMIQRLLRHQNISVTQGYITSAPQFLREAAAMHPYNQAYQTPEKILEDLEYMIRNRLKDTSKFDQCRVRQITALLWSVVI